MKTIEDILKNPPIKKVKCPRCNGRGYFPTGTVSANSCPVCNWNHTISVTDFKETEKLIRRLLKMDAYIDVPINAAEYIAKKFNKNQVVIVCWDQDHGRSHVTTFGKTKRDCKQAAIGGNKVKKALGWPDHLCHAKPVST